MRLVSYRRRLCAGGATELELYGTQCRRVFALMPACFANRKQEMLMTINFTIPEPIFWVAATIGVILLLSWIAKLLYPGN